MKWVNKSDRSPAKDGYYVTKADGGYDIFDFWEGEWLFIKDCCRDNTPVSDYYDKFMWLDEEEEDLVCQHHKLCEKTDHSDCLHYRTSGSASDAFNIFKLGGAQQ